MSINLLFNPGWIYQKYVFQGTLLSLKTATIEEFTAFLRNESQNFYKRKKAEDILAYVERDGDTTNDFQDLWNFIVTTSVKQLNENFKLIAEIEEELKQILPRFGYKLESSQQKIS